MKKLEREREREREEERWTEREKGFEGNEKITFEEIIEQKREKN